MAPLLKVAVLLNLSLYAAAQGTQFITGACTSDADCASACCGFNSGKCAAPIPAQERDGGCGFGDAQPNSNALNGGATGGAGNGAASSVAAAAPAAASAAGTGSGKAPGTQFITGACASDAECASACCGFNSGKCAAPIVAQEKDGGCGFGDAQPNANALQGGGADTGAANDTGATAQAQSNDGQAAAASSAAAPSATGATAGAGTQFITGPCTSDADCGSNCCGFNSGKCAGPVVAQERDGGCGFGDAQPNDNAAQALQGRSLGKFGASYM